MVIQNQWTPTVRRGAIAAEFKGPGPAAFRIESSMGKGSPQYTFRQKHEPRVDRIKPGPGSYQIGKVTNKGPETMIAPTMSAKLKEPEKFNNPSPGQYEAENLYVGPEYSFGKKLNDEKPNQNPSPGHYEAEVLDAGPCYSFGVKLNEEKPNQNPSPNQYNMPDILTANYESGKKSSPSYTIRPKTSEWTDKTKKPGPGVYSPEKVNLKKERPSYTFGCKHSPYMGNLKENRK